MIAELLFHIIKVLLYDWMKKSSLGYLLYIMEPLVDIINYKGATF